MTNTNYNYTDIYNEHWQSFMNEVNKKIDCVAIARYDKDDNKLFGFANVFDESDSPYDFCARIGYTVLSELMKDEEVDSIKISSGSYMFTGKRER